MTVVNFPVSVVLKALDQAVFVTIKPSDDFDTMKKALVKYDDEIGDYKDKDIERAIELWFKSP